MPRSSRRSYSLITSVVVAISSVAVITVGWAAPALASSPAYALGSFNLYDGLPAGGQLSGISCTGAGDCTVIGMDGNFLPAYATETSGRWGALTDMPLSLVESSVQMPAMLGISCTKPADCTAVGSSNNGPVYGTESAGRWKVGSVPTLKGSGELVSVSCTSPGSCTAVGDSQAVKDEPIYATESAGRWSRVRTLTSAGGGGRFTSVSCPTAATCTAVGVDAQKEPIYARKVTGVWHRVTVLGVPGTGRGGELTGISCNSKNACTATGFGDVPSADNPGGYGEPLSWTEIDGVWGKMTVLAAPGGLVNSVVVSCHKEGDCTAVGEDPSNNPVSATRSGGRWGTMRAISASGDEVSGVSCVTDADCTATGYRGSEPLLLSRSAGKWSHGPALATPGGGPGDLNDVSCVDPTHCTAVGTAGYTGAAGTKPFYSTEVDGQWGPATQLAFSGSFYGVSCTDAVDCTAVGAGNDGNPIYATESAGAWSTVKELQGSGGMFLGISCTSAADCTAVGTWGSGGAGGPIYASESNGVWSEVTELTASGGGSFNSVSCAASTSCTAVGQVAGSSMYATESSGVWSSLTTLPGGADLNGVSCTSVSDCTAVGGQNAANGAPIFLTESAGTWGAVTELPGLGELAGVSCIDALDCAAVGSYIDPFADGPPDPQPIFATETSGVWSPLEQMGGSTSASGISCTSPAICVTVGTADVGFDYSNVPVYAATVPGPPEIGTATAAGVGTATVAFTPPANDTGQPITSYSVVESSGGGEDFATTSPASCTSSPCTVIGLAGGTSYTFQVAAITNNGGSPYSASSNTVTTPKTVPDRPRISSVIPENREVVVKVKIPFDGGDPITKYTVFESSGHGYSVARTLPAVCTAPCFVTRLTNGTRYTFEVAATNAKGTSPVSAPSAAVTPATVPSSPAIREVKPGNHSATVEWLSSKSDGGSRIIAYTANAVTRGAVVPFTCRTSATRCTITGLTNGQKYTVFVYAVNAVGPSPSSATVSLTPRR